MISNPPGSKIVDKTWGREDWLVNFPKYCAKLLIVNKDHYCSLHYHKLKEESFFVQAGKILFEYSYPPYQLIDQKILSVGESVHIEPLTAHRFTAIDDTLILEVSSQHFDEDSYRLEPSGKKDVQS